MAAVKRSSPAKVKLESLAGVSHGHLCSQCVRRYDDRCEDPGVDRVCPICRNGTTRPIWWVTPQACCTKGVVRLSQQDAWRAHLGGKSVWWECTVCKRKHPFDPRGMELSNA